MCDSLITAMLPIRFYFNIQIENGNPYTHIPNGRDNKVE